MAQDFLNGIQNSLLNLPGYSLGKFHNLLAAIEHVGLSTMGLRDTLNYASNRPIELGYEGDHRGEGDAMRHILMAAELQRTHPLLAKPLLYGHEFVTNTLQGQPAEEREQDLYNNNIGMQLGQLANSRSDVERMARIAVKKAKILPPAAYGNY